MTSPSTFSPSDGRTKVESLVKDALKDALARREASKGTPSELMTKLTESVAPMKKEPLPILVVPAKVHVLGESQKFLSDVIGIKDVSNDFPVTCFHSCKHHESVAAFIPEVDHDYYLDKDLASAVLQAWELGDKILCYGPTGSGKSSLIEQLCARTHRPFIRINCTGDMDSSMIFGQLLAKDGSTYWVDGPVTESVKHGAVFCWDEWDVTPPEIGMGLQWLLEDNGKLFLKDMPGELSSKMIKPHENFRIVAIGNTQGQGDDTGAHAGTNVQNSATLDRFGTCLHIDYLPTKVEVDMLIKKCASIPKTLLMDFVKFANLIRTGYKAGQLSLTMSQRTLFTVCKKVGVGIAPKQAFSLVYFNKLNPTQQKVAMELWGKIFGGSSI
jgi:cobaltochelatase CobS